MKSRTQLFKGHIILSNGYITIQQISHGKALQIIHWIFYLDFASQRQYNARLWSLVQDHFAPFLQSLCKYLNYLFQFFFCIRKPLEAYDNYIIFY